MFGKWIRKVALSFFCLLAIASFIGASYQFISTKIDERRYAFHGEMVDIGGYKLHIYNTGSGGPAVVLDAGLGCFSLDWGLVQSELSKFTQVVSYDRAGTGWSEPSPLERTSQQIVYELHTLLEKANIPKPYILVGHSFGGNNVQLYAATYPDEVLGMVLVDSCHPEQVKRLPPNPFQDQINFMQSRGGAYLLNVLGINRYRLQKYADLTMLLFSQPIRNSRLALSSTIKHNSTVCAEARALPESLQQLGNVGYSLIKDKPCYVLSAGYEIDLAEFGLPTKHQKFMNEVQLVWDELQQDLVKTFQGSHHLIAEKSDHMIPWKQPELIVEAVQALMGTYKPEVGITVLEKDPM